jgi:hypothetical protein
MSTLAELKAEIADDLDRTDLTTQIASETTRAIKFYQPTRFYFNETRDVTFSTVAAQALYGVDDAPEIPQFFEIDQICLEDGDQKYDLDEISPKEWEAATGSGGTSSKPIAWAYFNQSIGLYPIPDDAYTIRIVGHIKKAEPTADDEEGNVWMVEAFDLIRARVCKQLALKKLRDQSLFETQSAAEADELRNLLAQTATKTGTGFVTPSDF